MPSFPFTSNLNTGRTYYGPSLESPQNPKPIWTGRDAPGLYDESHPTSNLIYAGLGFGSLLGSGFISLGKNKRVWDYYLKGLRGIEEYSPAGMFKTFQLSNFFSQFETATQDIHISADLLKQNIPYRDYLYKVIGTPDAGQRMLSEGLHLKGGQLLYAQSGDVALKYAGAMRVAEGTSAHMGSAYARAIGADIPSAAKFFEHIQPYPGSPMRNPTAGDMAAQIIGGRNLGQHAWRQASMVGTELVSRFNRLLEQPFEMQPFKTVFGVLEPLIKNRFNPYGFAVKQGTGLQMLGRLTGKYGLGLGALALGYQTVDWAMRQSDFLDDTAFDQGLTAGLGTIGVKANLLASRIAEFTGGHAYREAQEEIAPGSTSFSSLLAFPLIGAMVGSFSTYGYKVHAMAQLQRKQGLSAAAARTQITEGLESFTGTGLRAKLGQLIAQPTGLYSRQDTIGKVMRAIATRNSDELVYKFLGKIGPGKLFGMLGAAIGTAAVLPFLPGALVPSTRPEELEAIYSGQQEVAVRKGRWWEFGRSSFEGDRIDYFRPHWYPRMLQRARDKAIWGEDEPSPLTKMFKREFTYDLERKHYYDRPYPITSLPFEDVPFIGPILANTIGRLIKPPKLMHTEEWLRTGEGGEEEYLAPYPRFGQRVATELGELPGGKPTSPYSIDQTIGEQAYRMTEMIGLPGFIATSIKESLTGTADLFDTKSQLESARRIDGIERWYWDQEIGGGIGTTEALRRLYPHRRRQIELYNPIRNTMPEWLPGPGERASDFLHGDPYTKVKEGEMRLPGAGYAARFPELKGVAPADYPLIHQYRILADVAPYTEKFKQLNRQIRGARTRKDWTDYEEQIYQTTKEQVQARKTKKEFNEYEYLSPMGELFDTTRRFTGAEASVELLSRLNEIKASGQQEPGVISKIFGGYWEWLAHNAETTLDQLTPMSPGAKLVHRRSAIEDYERTQVYGTTNAFWSHPYRDFIRPTFNLTAEFFGFDGIPDHIQERRGLEEYFDILEYTKYARLSNMARNNRDKAALKEFEEKKDQTLFGINPFTRNYTSLFRALPRRDRDYFNAFSEADTAEERQEILKLVPENERSLYTARWKLAFADEVKKAKKAEMLSEKEEQEADAILSGVYDQARSEGFENNRELTAEYLATRAPGENYGDWYRRTKLLKNIPLPGPDWCFPGNTLVLTEQGYQPIENIKPFEKVLTRDGWQYVLNNLSRETEEDLLIIKWSQDTDSALYCTKEHPLFLNDKFIPASKAKINDMATTVKWDNYDNFVLPIISFLPKDSYKCIESTDNDLLIVSSKPGPNQKRCGYIKTTDDFYWMLGWYLAEGNIRYCGSRWRGIEFTLSLDEENIAKKIANILEDIFLQRPKITKRYRKTGNSISVILNNQIAAHVLYNLCGRYSDQKCPSFPGSLRQQKIAADACLQGDGSFEKNRSILNTTSRQLALWFRDINVACNKNVSFRKQVRENRKDQYRVSILAGDTKPRIIKSIETISFKGKVYNLQIAGANEFYTIFGLVHNCGWHPSVDLEDIKLKVVQTLGEDMHEYDLWPQRAAALMNKPYINMETIKPILEPQKLPAEDAADRVDEILLGYQAEGSVFTRTNMSGDNSFNIQIEQEADIDSLVKGMVS